MMEKLILWFYFCLGLLPIFGQEIVSLELSSKNQLQWEWSLDGERWTVLKLPENLVEKSHQLEKIYYLRVKFDFALDLDKQYSLFLGMISDKDRVYLNDHLVGSTGVWNSNEPSSYDKTRIYPIPAYLLEEKNNEIFIAIQGYFPYEAGILEDVPRIDLTENLQKEILEKDYKKISLLAVYLATSIYFLFLYFRLGFEKENLLFALASMALVVYQFLRTQIKFDWNMDFVILKKIEYIFLALAISLYCNFIYAFLQKKNRSSFFQKLQKLANHPTRKNFLIFGKYESIPFLNIFTLIGIFLYINSTTIIEYDFINKQYFQPLFLLYILAVLLNLIAFSLKKRKDAIYLLVVTIFLGTSVILDILIDRGIFFLPRTSGFTFLLFHIVVGFTLANKLIRLKNELKSWNLLLEERIKFRTKELQNSLQEIKDLKNKQDADYFLTTLLINPLQKDENKSKNVKSEIYTNQKKKFDFRNKTYQIGGDISICDNIKINGRGYTVLLNGDAMGKSIQGAGGAIVLGILFRTILNRSRDIVLNHSSDKWLEGVFREMQMAFESFGGSMFISAFLGLIDDFTGDFYYINAEHPGIVLYRDGIALFLDNSQMTRKLGTPENTLQISYFKLQDKDIVFAGSDGKDDLLVLDNGISVYNQDENLFLRQIENSKGHLYTLVYNIMNQGEITDDLSLLKFQYLAPVRESTQVISIPQHRAEFQKKTA